MVTLLTVISSESRIYISLTSQGDILVRRLYKGAFRYPKYHPDVASAFVFRISRFLMIPLGLIFCSTFSPKEWDPFSRARYCPDATIANLIPRDPEFIIYVDAYLKATGGFSGKLKF